MNMLTTTLTAPQWGVVFGLALVMPLVVEIDKLIRRRLGAGEQRGPAVQPA